MCIRVGFVPGCDQCMSWYCSFYGVGMLSILLVCMIFMSCSVLVSGLVVMFVVYLVLLNVVYFLSLGVSLCSGCDGCVFTSNFWKKYNLRKSDLFVLSCARMWPVFWGVFLLWCLYVKVVVCSILLVLQFCDYGGVYCCEAGVFVLFCNY